MFLVFDFKAFLEASALSKLRLAESSSLNLLTILEQFLHSASVLLIFVDLSLSFLMVRVARCNCRINPPYLESENKRYKQFVQEFLICSKK